jgi:hypothetical protein
MGGHAIALTGFSLGVAAAVPSGPTGFLLRASRIDKLYGHDDQVGPFARMVWDTVNIPAGPPDAAGVVPMRSISSLRTSWQGVIHAEPNFVLLPLYHKIRIPFSLIHDAVLGLDALLEPMRQHSFAALPRAEWDIFLTSSNDYKSAVRAEYAGLGLPLSPSLTANLPRFLWQVVARTGDRVQLDVLFDATGIAQHDLVEHVVASDGEYPKMITAFALHGQALLGGLTTQARALVNRFVVSPIAPPAPSVPCFTEHREIAVRSRAFSDIESE